MFNLANQLTLARIFFRRPHRSSPLFPGEADLFSGGAPVRHRLSTDFLDGHIARKSNMVTSFGSFSIRWPTSC
ncbi:MAG: CDP-alcohol phosphatidyltransferase family protein [Bilophila sp.]